MATQSLSRKLKLAPGQRIALIGAPPGYRATLGALPAGCTVADKLTGTFDWIQVFVSGRAELEEIVPKVLRALRPETTVWFTYPKGTSKKQTDLTRDHGWESLQKVDLKWITLVSIDNTWSAFALRTYKPGEERQSFR